MSTLTDEGLDLIFRQAHTYSKFQDKPVSQTMLQAVYDLMRWGPTSANCCPARFVFITSPEAKERLRPHLMGSNEKKTMAAPATVIVAHDMEFYEKIPQLYPGNPGAREWFAGEDNKAAAEATAFRNGTLQGAYFILAARSLGLACGPMSGFDNAGVDKEFFADKPTWRSNFLINVGYGAPDGHYPRSPRMDFDEACEVL